MQRSVSAIVLVPVVLVLGGAASAGDATLTFDSYEGTANVMAGGSSDSFADTLGPGDLPQPPAPAPGSVPGASIGDLLVTSQNGEVFCASATSEMQIGEVFSNFDGFAFDLLFQSACGTTNPIDELDPCHPAVSASSDIHGVFTATLSVPAGAGAWTLRYGVSVNDFGGGATYNLRVEDGLGGTVVDQDGATPGGSSDPEELVVVAPPLGETYTITISGDASYVAVPGGGENADGGDASYSFGIVIAPGPASCELSGFPACGGDCPVGESCVQGPGTCFCDPTSAPSAVEDVEWSDDTRLSWPTTLDATTYNVYRYVGARLEDFDEDGVADSYGDCFDSGLVTPEVFDFSDPAAGLLHTYLVTGVNAFGESTLGETSDSQERPNPLPCP